MKAKNTIPPLLRLAIRSGSAEALLACLEKGNFLNSRDSNGNTPLMLAARWGSVACAELLIANGADPSAIDDRHHTAAEIARAAGFLVLADALSPSASAPVPDDPFSPSEVSVDLTGWDFELTTPDAAAWQPEVSTPLPEHDASCTQRAEEAQRRITTHGAQDDWEVWSAEGITLPEIRKIASLDDLADNRAAQIIRALFTTSLKAGQVSPTWIKEQLTTLEIRALESTFCQSLTDLGVLLDNDAPEPELPQQLAEDTAWPPLYELPECSDVEALILDMGWSSWDPDRLYQLALDDKLLSHEEEIQHGRTLRTSLEHVFLLMQGHPNGQLLLAKEAQELCIDRDDRSDDLPTDTSPDPELASDLPSGDEDEFCPLETQATAPHLTLPQATRLLGSLLKTGLPDALRTPLEQHLRTASKAREILITKNLRLVLQFANKYRFGNIPLSDLIQEGNIGLIKAVDKYDPELGFKFSTYACWWIRQAIGRSFADTCRVIRVPVHMHNRLWHLERALHNQEHQTNLTADVATLATELDWTPDEVRSTLRVWNRVQIEERDLDTLSPQDVFSEGDAYAPETVMAREILGRSIGALLGRLKPTKAANIIRMRFGIGLDREYTLEEIGQALNVTRERIRQIEAKALRHISKIAAKMFSAEAPVRRKAEKGPAPHTDMPESLAALVTEEFME
ncbi:sigma-70 family RNA polymerase sigma factor [Vitreoscilla filiformis]|uniref:sigma-70 family RNA polymerase sigma factor n=1 Tax=Vitreoscilla filiformis TaxID=63 RepID=UPI0012FD29BD|nr:sigma-70 family RNA polymerase sigma factor [Vitreoscilla filiformis]